ncbi:Panacea domain-containing protein [Aedoeadaptatus acetigenes]|uniref:Panacea domain-containing protein n=1 Tax=Aedoeadaptatus acetigenes TaxID=2981723 RepID=UPI0011DDDE3D|nr:Panacea domain-containing protein [Aedoeadaptatus acetigenes]MCU6786400.1 DUF4065 domain-containing protein [Aedoeadaptatus acetigenes]
MTCVDIIDGVYSANDIANWFLNYNFQLREFEDEDTDNISNLKLQKLLYYAQGTFLAIHNQKLFNDPIVAWKHGPVVESVYQNFKSYGASGIDQFQEVKLDDETVDLLIEVYDVFGKYSAWGLREMTHQEDPWKNTNQSDVIDPRLIKKYFEEHYVS